jgi:hypothetical protein
MQIIQYSQTIFIIIFLILYSIEKSQNKSINQIRKDIFNFSVIPSLVVATSGHLLFGNKIRKSMKWDNTIGTITLERELGITQLVMLIIAFLPNTPIEYISSMWGIMLILMGFNHFIVSKKLNLIGLQGIVYGGLLTTLYSPIIFDKKDI